MTAEIAIMNVEAIALAADSAVTMTTENGEKISTSANKLFRLSKRFPVGIMTWGNANFMGLAWETIIKIIQNEVVEQDKLEQYTTLFIDKLKEKIPLIPESVQEEEFLYCMDSFYQQISEDIEKELYLKMDVTPPLTEKQIDKEYQKISSQKILEAFEKLRKSSDIITITETFRNKLNKKIDKKIDAYISSTFPDLSAKDSQLLKECENLLITKIYEDCDSISGITIAGFGKEDIFPSFNSIFIQGVLNNQLKYRIDQKVAIDFKNTAVIEPFAQNDMILNFINGITPEFRLYSEDYLNGIFEKYPNVILDKLGKYTDDEKKPIKNQLKREIKKIVDNMNKDFEKFRKENYSNPIYDVVALMPKTELAIMAESLIHLTSLKQKFSMGSETVKEPIDVAIISKGEGFIWIKRKHYFDQKLNPHYLMNNYRELIPHD